MDPYYSDDLVTLYHADCLDDFRWIDLSQVLVTDPPYGRNWRSGNTKPAHRKSDAHRGIIGDESTEVRDRVLALWGERPGIVFGDLVLAPPAGTKQVLVYLKPLDAGFRGAVGGFRRDLEAVYLIGGWPSGLGGRSSLLTTSTLRAGGEDSPAGRYGHPHAKPVDLLEELVSVCPAGMVADPFAGSGSILVAARNLGRRAIGIEVHEAYCETAARRLSQTVLDLQ